MKIKSTYFCLSAETRKKLYVGIKVVSLITTGLCALYLFMVLYSFYRHRFLLHVLIISLFDDLYKNLILLGVLSFLVSVMSFKLNINLKNQPTNHSLPRTHRVWVLILSLTLLATAACASLMGRAETVVDDEVGPRLKHGLSHYMDTPSWGTALDRVQSYLQCCGVHGPSDWYTAAWIPLDRLSGQNVDYKLVQPTGRVQVPLVPSSCCRVVSAECGHKAWMETKTRSWADIKPVDASRLHTGGCEEAIRDTVARDMLIFKIILLAVFILQIVLLGAARLLFTSTINSVMLGRPQGKAPGWLIGPRLLCGKARQGYLQDYDDRCQHIETGDKESETRSHKSKWKCLSKISCRRSDKDSDTEGGGRRGFKSPCIAKLKSCSRKFKKKKNKGGNYRALESESDISPDREKEEKGQYSSEEGDSGASEKTGRKKSPGRMRTGGNERQYLTHNAGRKISDNLIDVVVDTFDKNRKSEIFEARANQLSPFFPNVSTGRKSVSKNSTSDKKVTTFGNKSFLEPKKGASVVVEDFKKRRELFERFTGAGKVETALITIPPPTPGPLNIIDLDGVESAKSLAIISSGTEVTSVSSKHVVKPQPTTLRNYPPLSPLE